MGMFLSFLGSVTFGNEIQTGTFVVIALGLVFAGYFGFRDKSWRNSAAGWKDSFEQEASRHKDTQDLLRKTEAELIAYKARPDLTSLSSMIMEHDKHTIENQTAVLNTLQEIASHLQDVVRTPGRRISDKN